MDSNARAHYISQCPPPDMPHPHPLPPFRQWDPIQIPFYLRNVLSDRVYRQIRLLSRAAEMMQCSTFAFQAMKRKTPEVRCHSNAVTEPAAPSQLTGIKMSPATTRVQGKRKAKKGRKGRGKQRKGTENQTQGTEIKRILKNKSKRYKRNPRGVQM